MAVRPIDASHFGEIMEQWKKDCLECDDQHGADVIADVILQLDDIPTLTPPNEWVSVEERLPEESYGMVLLTNGKVVIYGYRNKLFRFDRKHGVFAPAIKRGGGYMQVTYWMPLPAPPDRCPPEREEET